MSMRIIPYLPNSISISYLVILDRLTINSIYNRKSQPSIKIANDEEWMIPQIPNFMLKFYPPYDTIVTIEYYLFAGGLLGVEKVKPDPLNLLANTSVGSRYLEDGCTLAGYFCEGILILGEEDESNHN